MTVARLAVLAALAGTVSCAQAGRLFHRGPEFDPNVEQQYHRALALLQPAASSATLDSASQLLDAYLANQGVIERRTEATVLRRLVGDALQLTRVTAALQAERSSTETRTKTETVAPRTDRTDRADNDSVKEIQRLKEELSAANAELERIRKRLATQKP